MISVQPRFPGAVVWFRALLLSAMLVAGFAPRLRAQDTPASEAEVRALREELQRAKAEAQALKDENARLRNQAPGAAPIAAAAPAPAAIPATGGSPPPASVPAATLVPASPLRSGAITLPAPVAEGTAVSVDQLLQEYRTSTLGGDARYKGRRIQLAGTVRGFKKTFVGLSWIVELQAGDKLGIVRCTVSFPGLSDFRPSQGNRLLEGRKPFRAWQKILETGETLVVEGEVGGVDGAVVLLKDCRPVKAD
jgi:hypothetical protein